MVNKNIDCPVDFVTINERKARLTAAFIFIFALAFLFTRSWAIPAFLTVDFFVRGFHLGRYSLLGWTSDQLIKVFNIAPKPTDQAPKRFAARIGLFFSIAILLLLAAGFTTASLVFAAVLALFAFLESAIGFCAGCHAFTFYSKIFKRKAVIV